RLGLRTGVCVSRLFRATLEFNQPKETMNTRILCPKCGEGIDFPSECKAPVAPEAGPWDAAAGLNRGILASTFTAELRKELDDAKMGLEVANRMLRDTAKER